MAKKWSAIGIEANQRDQFHQLRDTYAPGTADTRFFKLLLETYAAIKRGEPAADLKPEPEPLPFIAPALKPDVQRFCPSLSIESLTRC